MGSFVELVANALSAATILSCLFLKVPQIMSLLKRKSAEGLYLQAMLMEIISFTIMTLYNYTNSYSLMTYLEYPIILLQVYVLVYYVLKFRGLLAEPIVMTGSLLYFGITFAFITNIISKDVLSYLVPFCTPLSGFAKVTYIYGIIKAGNADAVSLTTWVISMSTNIARVFTVYVDSADIKLLTNFIISTVLSFGVFSTALMYQIKPQEQITDRRRRSHSHSHKHKD